MTAVHVRSYSRYSGNNRAETGQRGGEFAESFGDALCVLGVRIGVQEHDRDRLGSLELRDEAVQLIFDRAPPRYRLPAPFSLVCVCGPLGAPAEGAGGPTSGRSCRPIATTSSNPAFVISFARSA